MRACPPRRYPRPAQFFHRCHLGSQSVVASSRRLAQLAVGDAKIRTFIDVILKDRRGLFDNCVRVIDFFRDGVDVIFGVFSERA